MYLRAHVIDSLFLEEKKKKCIFWQSLLKIKLFIVQGTICPWREI